MKKLSKRLLSVLLSVLMVATMLPFMPITAMADAESDLEDAIAYFETEYVEKLAENGYSALYTNMSQAYTDYLAAIEAHTEGTASQMTTATNNLTRHWTGIDKNISMSAVYADKMEPFEEVEANGEVKIGDGAAHDANGNDVTSQPAAEDYNKIIYSDGASISGWPAANRIECKGTYGLWTYQNYYTPYYPSAVVLNDGKGEGEEKYPLIPVILGVSSNGSNSAFTPQFVYEATDGVDLTANWKGTIEGNAVGNGNLCYTKPTWPNLAVSSTYNKEEYNYGIQYISIQNGQFVNLIEDPYYSTNSSGYYQIYRNHFRYTLIDNQKTGYSKVEETYWMGAGSFKWIGTMASGTRSFDPTYISTSKIYGINYVLLLDEFANFFAKNSRDFTTEKAKAGALKTYFSVLDQATSLDPTDMTTYPYADAAFDYNGKTGMLAAVAKCGDDIEKAVADLQTATLDDTASQLDGIAELINTYKTKMYAGKVYTNMLPAYELYRQACQYRDAIQYGDADPEKLDPTLQTLLVNFTKAVGAMQEVKAGEYKEVSEEVFDGDSASDTKTQAYYDTFHNLVNVAQAPARNRNEDSQDTNGGLVPQMEYSKGVTYMYVPRAVGVYDGTNDTADHYPFSIPIMVGFTAVGGNIVSGADRYLRNYRSTTSTLKLAYNWKTRTFVWGDEYTYVNNYSQEYNKYIFDNGTPTVGTSNTTPHTQLSNYMAKAKAGESGYNVPNRTYIENPSLSQILNFDDSLTRTDNECFYNDTTNSSSFQSNMRSNHKGNTDDPENFYANVLYFQNPYTTGLETDTNFRKYYHKYSTMGIAMRNSSGQDTMNYDYLELYVINYKPIQDIITANEGFLTDKSDGGKNQLEKIGLENLTEGNIEKYFSDMDKLTSCHPSNLKYEYDNDEYENDVPYSTLGLTDPEYTGRHAATEQCAYDIWNILDSGTDKAIQLLDADGLTAEEIEEFKDVTNADAEHSKDGVDGNYYNIKDAIEADPNEVGECASGRYWDAYVAKLNAAKEAMVRVASKGYIEEFEEGNPITVNYIDPMTGEEKTENFTTIEGITNSLTAAYNVLGNAPKTRHTIRFDHRVDPTGANRTQYDTGVFVCTVNDDHKALYPSEDYNQDGSIIPGKEEDNTADLGVYDALSFAYTTIDFGRYENDYVIETAKDEFDKLLDDGTGVGEAVEESTDTGAEMDPQIFVDSKVEDLLTAINTANSDIYTVYFHPQLYVVAEGTPEEGDMIEMYPTYWRDIDIHGDGSAVAHGVAYGETLNLSVPSNYSGNVYKWVIETHDKDGTRHTSTRFVDPAVDGDLTRNYAMRLAGEIERDVYITAYMAPEAPTAETQTLVKLLNPYDKTVVQFVANKTDAVSLDNEGNLVVGDNTYELTDEYNVTGYTISGFDMKKDKDGNLLENQTVANYLTKDGTYAFIPVEFTKNADTFNYTLNGDTLKNGDKDMTNVEYDTLVTVESKVEKPAEGVDPFVAIAIDLGENYASTGAKFRYIPISYTRQFQFYAACDLDFVDITCNDTATEFYANGTTKIELGTDADSSYYRFAIERRTTKMPFIWAKMEKPENGQYMVYNYYTNIEDLEAGNDHAAEFVEAGTCFAKSNLALDQFNEGNSAVKTVKASKRLFDSSFSVKITSNDKLWARSYVKYKYQFVPAREEGSEEVEPTTIEAIIYGDVVTVE